MKPFIGLKRIWYGAPLAQAPTKESLNSESGILKDMKEVKNVHSGTWVYTQDGPETTEYKNELTGDTYFVDITSLGGKNVSFTLGQYDFPTRVDLQGGKYENGVWESPKEPLLIRKSIVAQTKTGNYIVFPNAYIISKVDTQEKNLGLGITAVAAEDSDKNLSEEYWIDMEATE